ncbi:hypothetical protein B0A55_03557 [Friedmanniomyces simplex]|uniref:Uncharacterized protein n=1 Tax=Friedmanniomyces simplex TaxID=329884 RepID=A0A4U0XV33_9PEZI|nr:hypothetical protein B0A55_03557 [Friedmanniomyces simplex]
METSHEEDATIYDWILARLNIHVHGACLPRRQQPLDCYMPHHVAYAPRQAFPAIDSIMQAAVPGAAPRRIRREDGVAWVYDRDAVTTWRLPDVRRAYEVFFWERAFESALARETVWIAIEAFLDEQQNIDQCNPITILQRFRDYVSELSTQPVTITTSSLVQDMLAAYSELAADVEPFSCSPDIARFVEKFVKSRECFFRTSRRQPYVEATFARCEFAFHAAELDLELHYTWAAPLLHFQNLRNAVYEGDHFTLQPCADDSQPCDSALPHTAEYYVGPTEPWLRWDDDLQSLQGIVPHQRASEEGALRLDAYTIPLHVMEILTKYFAGEIRLERVIRCALPLTVKRRPDRCAVDGDEVTSPPLRATASQTLGHDGEGYEGRRRRCLPLRNASREGSATRKSRRTSATPSRLKVPNDDTSWRLPVPRSHSQPLRAFSIGAQENKENTRDSPSNMKELSEQLKRKAEAGTPRPPSPLLRMDALSLARLYDYDYDHERLPAAQGAPFSAVSSPQSPEGWASNNPYPVFRAEREEERERSPLRRMDELLAQAAEMGSSGEEWPSFQSDL